MSETNKYYCVRDKKEQFTKGKIYEFNADGYMLYDYGVGGYQYKSYAEYARENPDFAACLAPLVQRPAKVGEWVYVTDEVVGARRGEVLKVIHLLSCNQGTYVRTEKDTIYGWHSIKPCTLLDHSEYLVLDGYQPEAEQPAPAPIEQAKAAQPEATAKHMSRTEILQAAEKCVTQDREQAYGLPEDNFKLIGELWDLYLTAASSRPDAVDYITPEDVANMMALLKIARIATGKPKADNYVDLAGYAACAGEIAGKEGQA